jgi:hypothetical protein
MSLIVAGELTVMLQLSSLPPSFTAYSGFILTVVGFFVMFAGFVLTVYYSRKRLRYMSEIERLAPRGRIASRTASTILDEYAGKGRGRALKEESWMMRHSEFWVMFIEKYYIGAKRSKKFK